MLERKNFQFEICANSVESCIEAMKGGADRVELCASIPEGGTTPSYGEIKVARRLLTKTRLHVIIRPRGGDFLYSPLEIERMKEDIAICRELGVDGVVFGCLTPEGDIDMNANEYLVKEAEGMSKTFHRAFDRCVHPEEAIEDIINLGFNRILTSGQQPTAEEGIKLLAKLEKQADGRIGIMAGCGVNENNIRKIYEATHISQYHFSARSPQKSKMMRFNSSVFMGAKGVEEDTINVTSSQRVKDTISHCLG